MESVVVAAASAFGVIGGAVVAGVFARRKQSADAARAASEAAVALIEPLTSRVNILEREAVASRAEIGRLQRRVDEFQRGIGLLCGQVRELGHTPVWEPGEGEE